MQTNLLLLLVEIYVLSCLYWGNYIWKSLKYKWQTYTFRKQKIKITGQKNHAVDKRTNQLSIFSGVLVVFFPNCGYVSSPHFQLLCEWTECNKEGFLEPWSAGYLCHSHIWSPGGTLSCSVIPMFSFQGVSRESKIKHHFLLAINSNTQSLSSADIAY